VYLLYDLLLIIAAAWLLPWYLVRGLRYGKSRRGIRERLGFVDRDKLACLEGREVLWIHAVSVGETRAVIPLIKALRAQYPEAALVLSNVTETGREIAGQIDEVDLHLFFPFDLSFVVRRVLKTIQPRAIVLVETEIWPNFIRLANKMNIPTIMVNGRISDRSFPRYRKVRALVRPIFRRLTACCMQTELDAARVRQLGGESDKVEVAGNLKFDMPMDHDINRDAPGLRRELGFTEETLIWTAGSTHPGEEELLLGIFERLRSDFPELALILVPRHPERGEELVSACQSLGLPVTRRSEMVAGHPVVSPGEVLVGDTLGEMLTFYAVADLVFVGGSFVPIGGHNVLEASMVKKAAIFGPYMNNFKEITRLLLEAGGGDQATSAEDLQALVARLLRDRDRRQRMGISGHGLLQKHAGATARTMAVINQVLER